MNRTPLHHTVYCTVPNTLLTLAVQVAAEGLSPNERAYLREHLQTNANYAYVDTILANVITPQDSDHLQDYVILAKALILTEAEIVALDEGDAVESEPITTITCFFSSADSNNPRSYRK